MPISISRFRNRFDATPVSDALKLADLRALMTTHAPRKDKDGALWSPTVYAPGAMRGNNQVESITCFVADVDNGTDWETLRERWVDAKGVPYVYFVHSSFSSTKLLPKWRVVFPLANPVPAAQWKATYRKLAVVLMDGNTDPATKDISRMYYLPSCPAERFSEAFTSEGGEVFLDPNGLPEPPAPATAAAALPYMAAQTAQGASSDGKPGAEYNEKATAEDVLSLLRLLGWREHTRRGGGVIEVTRPGKDEGLSGTIGYIGDGGNVFYCFTSSAPPFAALETYSPFAVYAHARCGGSYADAARELGNSGYGSPLPERIEISIDAYLPKSKYESPVTDKNDGSAEGGGDTSPDNDSSRSSETTFADFGDRSPFGEEVTADEQEKERQSALAGAASALPLTDMGNAERLVMRHGKNLHYCPAFGWFVWDGKKWSVDELGAANRLAKHTVRAIQEEAAHLKRESSKLVDEERRLMADKGVKAHIAHGRASESSARLDAVLSVATTQEGIPIGASALDKNPWILTCNNGTLDLRTGKLRPSRRGDLCTKQVYITYSATALCPVFDAFLARCVPDIEIRDYLWRFIGYCLTGDVSEQVMAFLYGPGGTGKSTFVGILIKLLGDLGMQASDELLTAQRSEVVRDDLAALVGKRVVATVETDQGKAMAEGLMKKITGGDRIRARNLYKDGFEFDPTHKILFAANHKPVIKNATDNAIWRRIHLVPFDQIITEGEKDKHLDAKLHAEMPGILARGARGCLEWQKDGLKVPDAIKASVEEYKQEADLIGQFIGETCVIGVNESVKAGELYAAYCKWCDSRNEYKKSNTAFGRVIAERPGIQKMRSNGAHYIGIGLVGDFDTNGMDEGEA